MVYSVKMNGGVDMDINLKKGRKALYVTVFIASLFMATLSGTFAYFLASASSTEVAGSIADTNISLDIVKLESNSSDEDILIPIDLEIDSGLDASKIGSNLDGDCLVDGYFVCDVYRVGIKAGSETRIDGYLKIEPKNDGDSYVPNIRWTLLGNVSAVSINSITNISASPFYNASYFKAFRALDSIDSSNMGEVFTSIGSSSYSGVTVGPTMSYYYLMVWLEDTGEAQSDVGYYAGTLSVRGFGSSEGVVTANFGD